MNKKIVLALLSTSCIYAEEKIKSTSPSTQPTHRISIPIANCLAEPLSKFIEAVSANAYNSIGYAAVGSGNGTYTRINQPLFGTPVTVVEETKDEALIALYWKYLTKTEKNSCWVSKEHVQPLTNADRHLYPNAAPFKTNQSIIVLTKPLTISGVTYSVGTRFVCDGTKYKDHYKTLLSVDGIPLLLPATSCIEEREETDSQKLRSNLITFAKNLTSDSNNLPVGAFGGGAIVTTGKTVHDDTQNSTPTILTSPSLTTQEGKSCAMWDRADRKENQVAAGVDPAHAVSLLLTLAGKAIHSANTTHLMQALPEIAPHEKIESGYVLAYPGGAGILEVHHDQTVTIYIAPGYDYGYGAFVGIPLEQAYQGMNTAKNLQEALANKRPLQFLKADGTPTKNIIKEFKILRV